MDGLPQGVGSRSIHPSYHSSSHGRQRGYMPNDATSLLASSMPFMMPSYPMMMMPHGGQPSCVEADVLSQAYRHHSADRHHGIDRGRGPPSYGTEQVYKSASFATPPSSSASRSLTAMALPTSSSAHIRDQYAAPVSQSPACVTPSVEENYSQCQDQPPQKQSASLEPPKKPLSPYMRFSKSVSVGFYFGRLFLCHTF